MIDDHKFRPAKTAGFSLTRDQTMHRKLMNEAERRLRDNREWLVPDNKKTTAHPNGIFADHISLDMGCLRRAVLSNREGQAAIDKDGEMPLGRLDDRDIVFFGNGYAWQWNILGLEETNTWSDKYQIWHSADANIHNTYVEAKQTRRSALKVADLKAGLSVEDVLVRDNEAWWNHMLSNMYLYGHRTHYLTINWINPGDAETFRFDATDEAVQGKWNWLEDRRTRRREYERLGTLPGIDTRTSESNCTYCPFLGQEPCLSEIGMATSRL
jgi:hypothetical protein